MQTYSDLLFSCAADDVSEAHIVKQVADLNYLVDSLLFRLLLTDPETRMVPRISTEGKIDLDLLNIIQNHRLSAVIAKAFVIDFLVRSTIYTNLHRVFFESGTFYGVGSDGLQRTLDRISDELVASGASFISILINP